MKIKKVLSLALCTVMVAGCFAGAASAAEDETWKIGGIGPLTGDVSVYGTAAMNGAKIAIDEINEAGGISGYQIEWNAQDDEHDTEKAVNAYNTLKDWGMQILIGTVTTAPCNAVGPVAADDNIFMITPSASAEDTVHYGPNEFRMCFTDPAQGTASAQYIGENLDVTKVGVIYDSSDVYSSGIYATFRTEADNYDFEIVAEEAFTADNATDFSAQIQAMIDAEAELVFLPFYYTEASIVLTQSSTMEYSPMWFGVDGMDGILSLEGFDTSLAEGVMLLTPFAADAEDDLTVNFVTTYEDLYGEIPNQFAADGYDCAYAIKAALETTDLTPADDAQTISDALSAAMLEITMDGLTGEGMVWDENGDIAKSPKAVEIQDGVYVGL